MTPIPKKALEAAARALCRYAGMREDLEVEGMPMWASYLPEALEAVEAALPLLGDDD